MREKSKFQNGDVVQLNSGGPLMTVSNIDTYTITCVWFNTNLGIERDRFMSDMLTKLEK